MTIQQAKEINTPANPNSIVNSGRNSKNEGSRAENTSNKLFPRSSVLRVQTYAGALAQPFYEIR